MNKLYPVTYILVLAFIIGICDPGHAQRKKPRGYGIELGIMKTGSLNSITDIPGVKVGQVTLQQGDSVRTGVTAILPHSGNIYQQKIPAAVHVSNGFGKLTGTTQIRELGQLETPIVLTNTLSVPTAADALITYTLEQPGNSQVRSVNPVVGETNDGWLNDIRGRHIQEQHILKAIYRADTGNVKQGVVGAGTGTIAFGFKGGIGTASRVIPEEYGGYRVGVLVQSNFGGVLRVDGVPVGEELNKHYLNNSYDRDPGGSCMIIVATDAPMKSRNLERLAKRATFGLARTGGIASNGSGDYVIAFSTHPDLRMSASSDSNKREIKVLRNDVISPLFMAAIEATEEAIINSLFAATDLQGFKGHTVKALPASEVMEIMSIYGHPVDSK